MKKRGTKIVISILRGPVKFFLFFVLPTACIFLTIIPASHLLFPSHTSTLMFSLGCFLLAGLFVGSALLGLLLAQALNECGRYLQKKWCQRYGMTIQTTVLEVATDDDADGKTYHLHLGWRHPDTHTDFRFSAQISSEPEAFLRRFPIGSSIPVLVDPDDLEHFYLIDLPLFTTYFG